MQLSDKYSNISKTVSDIYTIFMKNIGNIDTYKASVFSGVIIMLNISFSDLIVHVSKKEKSINIYIYHRYL